MPASLPEDARHRLAQALRDRVLPRFAREEAGDDADARAKKAQTAAARKLGCSPSTISRLVNHEQGGSYDLVRKVALYLNEDIAAFLEGHGEETVPALRALPGFDDALREAVRRSKEEGRDISPEALRAAGDFKLTPALKRVTAQLLITLAVEYSRGVDAPVQKKRRA